MADVPEEKVNILIVDDRPDKLLTYEVMLAELSENIVRANSGREALRWLLRKDFAVILLDVNMPEMDGFQLYRKMKEIDSKVKVCFLTASELYYEGVRKESFCKEDKVDKELFLAKPIENEDLVNQINKIISSNIFEDQDNSIT